MRLADVPLILLLVGLVAYAVLGGADFGAGFWQLVAGKGKRADELATTPITRWRLFGRPTTSG